MCGRDYSTYTDEEIEMRYLNRKWPWLTLSEIPDFRPNYNMSPTQEGLVLNVENRWLGLRKMRWGLIPAWAKSPKDAAKYSLINARGEEIAEKRSYKNAFQKRRCIVPVSGFFEWKRSKDGKRPFAIHHAKKEILSIAGVWERWVSPDKDKTIDSFALITTAANKFMGKIHDRMPVILNEKDEERWLDPELNDPVILSGFLKPCSEKLLNCFEVSTFVNSPKNNSPAVLKVLG